MGVFMNILRSVVNSIGEKGLEIQESETKYRGFSDDAVINKLKYHSSSERIAAKQVLKERGYQFKDRD